MENEKRTCEKCRYGKQHYYIFNGRFTKITDEMHCVNRNITRKRFEKILRERLRCDCYESDEVSVQETKECVIKRLVKISEQLDNALQVLEIVAKGE